MNTSEHTEVGNLLKFNDMGLQENPYTFIDEQTGILSIRMQGICDNNFPTATNLTLTSGNIVGMSGDYFGGKEVDFDLPSLAEFNEHPENYNNAESLGHYLINEPISFEDAAKYVSSYKRLANPQVTQKEIETIYKINNVSNEYLQQILFAAQVKNYGEMLTRNLSHFTPWSVRAYTIGHFLALKYAKLHYELKELAKNPGYTSDNPDFNNLHELLKQQTDGLSTDKLTDLAHRYQALAIGMEIFSFHYYSDHFCAGHDEPVGTMRQVLPDRYGNILGGILVNNAHDESNRTTIFTRRPYDPNPDNTAPPVEAGGDGDFDTPQNYYNKMACVAGMQDSLSDLTQVFQGKAIPKQCEYAGLKHLPDIDPNYRQPQPLFILGNDNKVYYRTALSKIRILAPSQWKAAYEAPAQNGYTELSSKFWAFLLVVQLRLLSFIFQGKVQKPTEAELATIEAEEHALNPTRLPIPRPPTEMDDVPETAPLLPAANWKTQVASSTKAHRFFTEQSPSGNTLLQNNEEYTEAPSM